MGLLLVLFTGQTPAENNTDYIFNGTTNNVVGTYKVPSSGFGTNNSLQILNNGLVTATAHVTIGDLSLASNNFAIINGTGSVMQVGNNLYLGNAGSLNRLTVTNGGLVNVTGYTYVGNDSGAFGNHLIVDGPGSVLNVTNTSQYFMLGVASSAQGNSNQTTISNGGQINANYVRIGHVASSNLFTVTSGGKLETSNIIRVGRVNGHISRPERVHEVEFQPVGIFRHHVVGLHPAHRARPAYETAVLGIRQQRSKPLVHGLVPMSQAVENVAHRRHIQARPHELKNLLVTVKHG
jgi:T5SS/PEP-CTERM-associated repeat protein